MRKIFNTKQNKRWLILFWPLFACVVFLFLGQLLQAGAVKAPPLSKNLGGEGSIISSDENAFSLPLRQASKMHRREFLVGNSLFKENWVASPSSVKSRQGLGPHFNAQSCSSCHFKDGRGAPPLKFEEPFVGLLMRLSLPGKNSKGGPVALPKYGDQLQHRANIGIKPEGDVRISHEKITGYFADGTAYELEKPTYEFYNLAWGELPEETLASPRVAPQLVGVGLLEAISER